MQAGKTYTAPTDGYFVTDKFIEDILTTLLAAEARIEELEGKLLDEPMTGNGLGIDLGKPMPEPYQGWICPNTGGNDRMALDPPEYPIDNMNPGNNDYLVDDRMNLDTHIGMPSE